jgi:hypothetical protein
MGLFDSIVKYNPATAGLNFFANTAAGAGRGLARNLSGAEDMERRLAEFEERQRREREQAKAKQYDLVGQLRAPQFSDQYVSRIKALEDESKPTSLVEDPLFQGDRATLVQGGQQALSGIQNQQRAQDVSGGFSNTGSVNDIYDRLGVELSALGQKSRQVKEQKRDVAAQARQQMVDAQVNFDNAVLQAKSAIESGDSQMAMAMIERAYQAREGIAAAERQMLGQLLSLGGTLGSAAAGGGKLAAAPAGGAGTQAQPEAGPQNRPTLMPELYQSNPFGVSYTGANKPYYAMRA